MKITRIKLSLSNAYLVQDRHTILVDTGMPGEERKILQAAEKAGGIRLILHTHGHVDHAGSSADVRTFYVGHGGPLARNAVTRLSNSN